MFISYQNEEIRDSCLLLKSEARNSIFNSIEIKEIRAILADLRAAPKLNDLPLTYYLDRETRLLTFVNGNFKIICNIITNIKNPKDNQIERIKIIEIINIGLQSDLTSNQQS